MKSVVAKCAILALAAGLSGCGSAVPAIQQPKPSPSEVIQVTTEVVTVSPLQSPLITPTAYSFPPPVQLYPDRVVVNLVSIRSPARYEHAIPITMTLAQHLAVTLPGEAPMISNYFMKYDGRDTVDMVQLMSGIDPQHLPDTGWTWSARKVGQVLISISTQWRNRGLGQPDLYYDLVVHVVP